MEAGIYWLIGCVVVITVLAIIAVGEGVKAIAKEGKAKVDKQ